MIPYSMLIAFPHKDNARYKQNKSYYTSKSNTINLHRLKWLYYKLNNKNLCVNRDRKGYFCKFLKSLESYSF